MTWTSLAYLSVHNIITGLLQAYYRLITGLLQAYYRLNTGSLQSYYRLIIGLLQAQYRFITGLLQAYYMLNTGSLQAYYRLITGSIQVHNRLITGLLQAQYRLITGSLQAYYRLITVLWQPNTTCSLFVCQIIWFNDCCNDNIKTIKTFFLKITNPGFKYFTLKTIPDCMWLDWWCRMSCIMGPTLVNPVMASSAPLKHLSSKSK